MIYFDVNIFDMFETFAKSDRVHFVAYLLWGFIDDDDGGEISWNEFQMLKRFQPSDRAWVSRDQIYFKCRCDAGIRN